MAAKKPAKKAPAKKPAMVSDASTDFVDGLKYPWNNMGRLWNILWILIPILGWFVILGYVKKIVNLLVSGDKSGLPAFGNFGENLKEGFWVFVKLIPLMLVLSVIGWILGWIPLVGMLVNLFIWLFIIPYLVIHFLVTGEFAATFDYKALIDHVFGNMKDYGIALLKTVGFSIIYYVASFILIGIPCLQFGWAYYLAEFYANNHP